MYNKFIIKDGKLLLGLVNYHYELADGAGVTSVNGGGWFRIIGQTKLTFFGDSQDYGAAKKNDIEKCIKSGDVYMVRNNGNIPIVSEYDFSYDTQSEIIPLRTTKAVRFNAEFIKENIDGFSSEHILEFKDMVGVIIEKRPHDFDLEDDDYRVKWSSGLKYSYHKDSLEFMLDVDINDIEKIRIL